MNPTVWLLAGGILGWLASVEIGADKRWSSMANVTVGACGAFLAGWLMSLAFGADLLASSEFSVAGLVEASFGAVVLLVLVNMNRVTRNP